MKTLIHVKYSTGYVHLLSGNYTKEDLLRIIEVMDKREKVLEKAYTAQVKPQDE